MTDWLVDTLIASSALMALLLVLREPVRRAFGPAVTYALWLVPALRMIMPPLTQTVERPVAVVAADPTAQAYASLADLPALAPAVAPPPQTWIEGVGGWPTLLVALWLAGASLMLVRGLVCYATQRRAILSSGVQLAKLGSIRLIRSERVRGPVAFGIIDRVIVVPFDFDQRFTDRQRCLTLEHELSHHRSGDLVANLIAFVLLCLQWFNPLAWAAHVAFRFDQEAACDARVLDKAERGERALYGAAIAKASSGRTLLFSGALDRPSTLSRRLSIMTTLTSRRNRALGFVLLGAGLFLVVPMTASSAIEYVDVPNPATTVSTRHEASETATAQSSDVPRLAQALLAIAPDAPVEGLKLAASHLVTSDAPVETVVSDRRVVGPMGPVGPVGQVGPVGRPGPVGAMAFSASFPGGVAMAHANTPDRRYRGERTITIDGVRKRWEDLSAADRAEIREGLADARRDLQRELADLPREIEQELREAERERAQSLAEARQDIRDALAELHADRAELAQAGVDLSGLQASLQQQLRSLDERNFANVQRSVATSQAQAREGLRKAEQSLRELEARLNEVDR